MLKTNAIKVLLVSALLSTTVWGEDESEPLTGENPKVMEIGLVGYVNVEGVDGDSLGTYGALGIRGRYIFMDQWSAVAQYVWTSTEDDLHNDITIHRVMLDLNYDIASTDPEASYPVTPYIVAGLGYEGFDGVDNRDGAFGTVGLGLRYRITEEFGANLETKGKWNFDHTDRAVFISLGLSYLF